MFLVLIVVEPLARLAQLVPVGVTLIIKNIAGLKEHLVIK